MSILFRSGRRNEKQVLEDKINDILTELRALNRRVEAMHERIDVMEDVIGDRLPHDILTERKFKEQVQTGDEIVRDIISKVEELSRSRSILDVIEARAGEKPGIVEARRIETITGLLQQHGKLSSEDLANHTGLSRTRCSEYFKLMEEMGIVEPVLLGREKFYRLS